MDKLILENLLILTGEGFWVVGALVQLQKIVKTKDARGLSAATQVLYAAGNAAWATYFVVNHLWIPAATNLSLLVISAYMLLYIFRSRDQFVRGLVAIAVFSPITSFVILNYAASAGWLGVGYNAIAAFPWFIKVVTERKLTGLSAHSLWIAIIATSLVATYGLLVHSMPLLVGCALGAFYNITGLVYFYGYGHNGHKTQQLLQNIGLVRVS